MSMIVEEGSAGYIAGHILAGVGAVNWGLVGLFDFNLVANLLGTGMASTVVYGLVALGGLQVLSDGIMDTMEE